jgi:threonylcarbamoyladenosine tRNA methylthiotransferase MtaB
MTRVYLHTFGCKANQYDTEVVRQALESAGAVPVDDPAAAEMAVVNSCTVTHVSEAKMRALVRRIARANGQVRTVVMGCAAALDDGTISGLPRVAGVVSGADPQGVLNALGLPTHGVGEVLRRFERGARAWLKIQDGCDEHCTFCATTLARGTNRSRPVDEIVREAEQLADAHAEIVLTGVHIGTYGRDRDDGQSLGILMERLAAAVPQIRFRLSSVEATEVDDRLADLLAGVPESLAPHLHAPLQSGSDRILKRMGRHWYTRATYCNAIERLADRLPRLALGADIVVGFPGEENRDYVATRAVVEELPYTYLHVFPYSERPGTAARKLGRAAESRIVADRSAELREMASAKAAVYRASRDGERADVVLLRRRHGVFEGLTEDYLPVYLPTEHDVPGRFVSRLRVERDTLRAEYVTED